MNNTLPTKNPKTRVKYWDIAKFFAIFAILLDHTQYYIPVPSVFTYIRPVIFSFYVQLFFCSSGAIDAQRHEALSYQILPKKLLNRAKQIAIPYLIWSIFWGGATVITEHFNQLLYGTHRALEQAGVDSALWFLPCMFAASCLYIILRTVICEIKILIKPVWHLVIGLLLAFISNVITQKADNLPLTFDSALMACGLMFISYAISFLWERLYLLSTKTKAALFLIFSISTIVLSFIVCPVKNDGGTLYYPSAIWLAEAQFGINWLLFLLVTMVSITSVLLLSMLLENMASLVYLGQNTLLLLATHGFFFRLLRNFVLSISLQGIFQQIVLCILTFLLFIPAALLINRYFPVSVGKRSPACGRILFHDWR